MQQHELLFKSNEVTPLTFLTLFFVIDSTANTWSPMDESSIATARADSRVPNRMRLEFSALASPLLAALRRKQKQISAELTLRGGSAHGASGNFPPSFLSPTPAALVSCLTFLNLRHINAGHWQRAALLTRTRPLFACVESQAPNARPRCRECVLVQKGQHRVKGGSQRTR